MAEYGHRLFSFGGSAVRIKRGEADVPTLPPVNPMIR
jgi:hypothetical protein